MSLIVFQSFGDLREFASDKARRPYKTWKEGDPVPSGSVVSEKLDGIYARADKDGLWTKDGNPIKGQDHLNRRLKGHFRRKPDAVVEGELTNGKALEDTLSDYQRGKKLKLHAFPDQKDRPLPVFGIRRIKGKAVKDAAEADRHYQKTQSKGGEGQVIVLPDGTRVKRKAKEDSEYKVTGIKAGKRNQVADIEDGNGKARVVVPAHVKEGDLVTVSYDRRTRRGNPRAPRYKAVRDYE